MNHCSERTAITNTTTTKFTTATWPKGVQQRTRKRVKSVGSKGELAEEDGPAASPMPDSVERGATAAEAIDPTPECGGYMY